MIFLVVVAALAASADDPPPPLDPPVPLDPVPDDVLGLCKSLVANDKLEQAAQCFRDHKDVAGAVAMADVVDAWRAPAAKPLEVVHDERQKVSLGGLVESGQAEGMLHGSVAGAGAGFLVAATLFSATRQNQQDTLPWLIASPAVGAVGGAVGSFFLLQNTKPTTGDIALSASTMWTGATEGFLLQLAVFDQNPDVSTVPLRFATILGGGVVGLGAGMALSPYVDITQGDVAVANSALLWGGVLTGFGLGVAASGGAQLNTPQVSFALLAGSLVPYGVVLAAHPVLNIERWPSWLIEAGGAGGLLVGGAFVSVLGANGNVNSTEGIAIVGAGTAAGVVAGAGAAWFVSDALRGSSSTTPQPTVAPVVLLDDNRQAVPGLVVAGRF